MNSAKKAKRPKCLLISGPNGSGKTTFAMEYLAHDVRILNFVNADLVAAGLSPLRPQLAAVAAARLVLREIDRLIASRSDFAFESTLSGLGYANRLQQMRDLGYHIEIIYLQVSTTALALKRIAAHVKQGGHNVPRADVVRRFIRSKTNFDRRSPERIRFSYFCRASNYDSDGSIVSMAQVTCAQG